MKRLSPHKIQVRKLGMIGASLIALFMGTIGLWAATSTLSGAVIANGQFIVEGSTKKVQHATGGTVSELVVGEGQRVAEGELLVRLDETETRANLEIVSKQLDELFGRQARLEAERDGSDQLSPVKGLADRMEVPDVQKILESERALLNARRAAVASQKNQLAKRIAQSRDEISGLKAQQDAAAQQAKIIASELTGVRDLYAKNLVQLPRLTALEREAASIEGQRGQVVAAIAQAESRIAETEVQIIQLGEQVQADSMKELRDIQGKVGELGEKKVAAEDLLKHIDIRSPSNGYVHQLAVHTVGGVISPAESIMLIVPTDETLNVEARVQPQQIDQVSMGQSATVRVHSSDSRTTPELKGRVTMVSADVSQDQRSGTSYYTITVSIPKDEISKLEGHVKLMPGMQAEVFVEVNERTPFQYLLKPLKEQFARAFREP